MGADTKFDLIIIGGGIGGVICLKYALDAGLNAILLERGERVGGLWRDLPPWQDIQFRKEDWTLGDLPLGGEDQANILRNIEAWVERFELSPHIRLNASVRKAQRGPGEWAVAMDGRTYTSDWLIAATGGYNRPVIPEVRRQESSVIEYHSSGLRDPDELRDKRVTVVGGGASAYDLLDLCFTQGAAQVAWIYRSTKWMRPTRQRKYGGTDMRLLAKFQMLGLPMNVVNRIANRDLRIRYAKAGLEQIIPDGHFDFRQDQLIPGRRHMIKGFREIDRYRGEVQAIKRTTLSLSGGEQFETDVLLWGTGYATDYNYLDVEALRGSSGLNDIRRRCYSVFLSADAPNLFFLAPGVLESNTSTPWAYAHVAKSIMSHITGNPVFVRAPKYDYTNHFELVKMFAPHDRRNYPFGRWYAKYLGLALRHPRKKALPIP
jgi:Pyridine nucleotide-disulphide oxidoreductase